MSVAVHTLFDRPNELPSVQGDFPLGQSCFCISSRRYQDHVCGSLWVLGLHSHGTNHHRARRWNTQEVLAQMRYRGRRMSQNGRRILGNDRAVPDHPRQHSQAYCRGKIRERSSPNVLFPFRIHRNVSTGSRSDSALLYHHRVTPEKCLAHW